MKKRKYHKSQKFGKWTLESYLGGGGNGEVWQCINKKKQKAAIKILKSATPKSYSRFLDEVTILEENKDIEGIIPIIDKFLPEELRGRPYYVMPVAVNAEKNLKGKSIEEKINAVIEVCRVLKSLHDRGISHRDIKPSNLLIYHGKYTLADFGLVDYPQKKDVSLNNEEIGAKWTIAPEMRRESHKADGVKADIYSLAKTLWIILSENIKGFDGQYSPNSILELRKIYPKHYTTPIDKLLSAATDNDPSNRPNINEFISVLEGWKKLIEDFHEQNQEQWFEIQSKLFPMSFPKRVIWEDINDIINVLKLLCTYDDLNHMFFPRSGGLDLEDARLSAEEGCIELDFQLISIIKPKRLIFESFGYTPSWNYFRLELDDLEPSGVYGPEKIHNNEEELSELYPGKYDIYELVEYRSDYKHRGYDIPDGARQVTRILKGSLVIFNKRSEYNLDPSTYDARHNKMSTDEFREYIQREVELRAKRI